MSLLCLPVELLHQIFDLLPLSSLYQLGSVNRQLHRLIHQDDHLWRFKVRSSLRLLLLAGDWTPPDEVEDDGEDDDNIAGLVRDPSLQGHKEVFLLYASEFKDVLKRDREHRRGAVVEPIERVIRAFLPKFLLPTSPALRQFPPSRLALFGPGIESPNTRHLVHKVINSHTSVFDALSFIPGLPGGFGSGVRIDFRKTHIFDLMCLYTNSARVRENQRGVDRLRAANNKLLAKDVLTTEDDVEKLHSSVLKLLPTLDGLIFAVDATQLTVAADQQEVEQQLDFLRSELGLMIKAEDKQATPLLVLFCFSGASCGAGAVPGVRSLARSLGLTALAFSRPWAVFVVDIADMVGMANALDWMLYHCQKRRTDLEYHTAQSEKLF